MILRRAASVGLLLALAACGESEDTAYEVDATDEGGGELIVAEDQADAVEVDTPDTPMTRCRPDVARNRVTSPSTWMLNAS